MTERSADWWAWFGVLLCILVMFALLMFLTGARAHDSWISRERIYDPVTKEWCCSAMDCQEEVDNVQAVEGGYRIKSTGEVIERERVTWRSPGGWWRCRYLGGPKEGLTRCLIGPPAAS